MTNSRQKGAPARRKVLSWLPDYDISDVGEVRRITRPKGGPFRNKRLPRALNQYLRGPYPTVVAVPLGGKPKPHSVHRLVCEAFNGPPPERRMFVCHNDGDPENNSCDNLRWATPQENSDDRKKHGTDFQGSLRGNRKLLPDQIKQIRELRQSGAFYRDIAEQFNISIAQAHRISNGESWAWV